MRARSLTVGAGTALAVLVLAAPSYAGTRDRTPPTVPSNVRVTAVTEDSVSLAWSASRDNSGRIHHYVTCYSGFWIPGAWCIWSSPTPPGRTVTGLVPGKEFSFRIKAVDHAGNESALSAPVTTSTAPDVTPPTAPGTLRVTATTPSSVSLAWGRSTDSWGFGYQVLMDGEVIAGTAGLSFRRRHLAPGSTHTFAVRARDSSGNLSPDSNTVTVTLAASSDTTPPGPPRNLTATADPNDFCGTNFLRWEAAADDTDPASAIEYELYLNGSLFDVTTPGATAWFPYTNSGTNTWTAVAVDRAGNSSAPSNPATVTVVSDPNLC
jgi:chitodextrinase